MLKETRELLRYVLKHPSSNWNAINNGYELLLPTRAAQLRVFIINSSTHEWEISRIAVGITTKCDVYREVNYMSSNLTAHQHNKDQDLVGEVLEQAKTSGINLYKEDVAYLINHTKKSRSKSRIDDTNRQE